ncbi:MAG TPA: DUF559 domain-containing protein [Streptosporangiaceae bacterium]
MRRDGDGRRRWLDAYWEQAHLVVEVDGLWHMEATAWWADMRRDNALIISGLRVLRFPAFAVRDQPGVVAAQIRAALGSPRVPVTSDDCSVNLAWQDSAGQSILT